MSGREVSLRPRDKVHDKAESLTFSASLAGGGLCFPPAPLLKPLTLRSHPKAECAEPRFPTQGPLSTAQQSQKTLRERRKEEKKERERGKKKRKKSKDSPRNISRLSVISEEMNVGLKCPGR